MAEQPGFLARTGRAIGDNKWGMMGGIGGALLGMMLGGGNPLFILLGALLGGGMGSFMGDRENGALNNMLGRSTGHGRGHARGGHGHAMQFEKAPEIHRMNEHSTDKANPMYDVAVDANRSTATQAVVTDVRVFTPNGTSMSIKLDEPVVLPRSRDGQVYDQSIEAKALTEKVKAASDKIIAATSGTSADGVQISAAELNEINGSGLGSVRGETAAAHNQFAGGPSSSKGR